MTRTIIFIVAGLLMAAAIHIGIVLSVPTNAQTDAWARAGSLGADDAFHSLGSVTPQAAAATRDPAVMESVCRFTLRDGPIRIAAVMPDGFWSLALFDRLGRNIYSINDRAGDPSRLDVTMMTADQQAALGDAKLAALQNSIIAVLAIEDGMAVVRAFVPDEASAPAVSAALAAASCNAAV